MRPALVQTIGRAARNAGGRVILYADHITTAMRSAMDETARRRSYQQAYNDAHGIVPKTIIRTCRAFIQISKDAGADRRRQLRTKADREAEIAKLEKQMKEAAKMLEFEIAAQLRDQIKALENG